MGYVGEYAPSPFAPSCHTGVNTFNDVMVQLKGENQLLLWVLRVVGFALCWLGLPPTPHWPFLRDIVPFSPGSTSW